METYNGHVRTPADAIILFEACRLGLLPRVQRRLSEKERQQIKSGSVFVWDEREAGMRRWTDGKSWSASRVSGSFLTYREMEGKRGGSGFPTPAPPAKRPSGKSPDGSNTGDSEGEGPDGYRYKPDGLMKQSFSITTANSQHLHLISYYSRSHPAAMELKQPTTDPSLRHIRPPKSMYPESTVNETTNIPAVTRSPMQGSPFTPAAHQMPVSPYPRPGAAQPVFVGYPHGPPTPSGTPPYQYAAYYQPQPGHSPVPYGHVVYAQPHYAPGPTMFDRPPAQMANTNIPAHPQPHPYAHHPAYGPPPPQYQPHPHAALPEQGPQLPAINGVAVAVSRPENKPPSPQPNEQRPQESLAVPETSGATANNAPSPARTIPSVGALLNTQPTEQSTDGKSTQNNARVGSRSPNSAQRPREIPGDRLTNNIREDRRTISTLNSISFR
ncbi:Gti1/Pac2 family-domain-containing protein [Clohesyomyces aquaticus]|uniref:Gti1/Pac2 family-domain-containing protein n=1 Tax=Clohesyomyces aquaticus TaxID=1231657 RepID=A0A1Y1ZB64_9PLEO|nr:Gti1/Pac2 family-domain-containing protein [Clohesyomyces aquaticus]